MPGTPSRAEIIKKQWDVSITDKPLFSLANIIGVNTAAAAIRRLTVPPDAPPVEGLTVSAFADHVRKCQADVHQWDDVNNGILIGMSKLASDLETFCAESLVALEELSAISSRMDSPEKFAKLGENDKKNIQSDMTDIFSALLEASQGKAQASQAMATRLANFGLLLDTDATASEDIRKKYQTYIQSQEKEIRDWETKHGLTPSGDLLADLEKRVKELNDKIKQKQEDLLNKVDPLEARKAIDAGFPKCLLVVPAAIATTAIIVFNQGELKQLQDGIQNLLDQFAKYDRLNTVKMWFDARKETFDALKEHLTSAKGHLENLRGQWQTFTNDLSQLLDSTGKLQGLKRDDWLTPLNRFKMITTRSVYETAGKRISFFQKTAFLTELPVEVLKPEKAA